MNIHNRPIHGQPDEEAPATCPTCRQRWPQQDGDVEKFLRLNSGNFTPVALAGFLCWPLERLQRFARKSKIDLTLKKEPEARGA